ncbi:hypothetical protein, partial [Kutzneria buriramensis]|uniref:hypothetical protein n=1 Tax=Kutzneria buriramensis TaxID=1045776 RepID=UPI003749D0DC
DRRARLVDLPLDVSGLLSTGRARCHVRVIPAGRFDQPVDLLDLNVDLVDSPGEHYAGTAFPFL